MKYSMCVEMVYESLEFSKRFAAASRDGFNYCEFWRWRDKNWPEVCAAVSASGVGISAISGDDDFSPVTRDEAAPYISFLSESIDRAKSINCPNLVIHTDALNASDGSVRNPNSHISSERKLLNTYDVLKEAAGLAEREAVTLVLEPLNTTVDHEHYFLSDPDLAFELIDAVDSQNVKLLFDIYHMQIMKGNVTERLIRNLHHVGYIHAADVPGRHEPGTGELNYGSIFRMLNEAGYDGFIGFELSPAGDNDRAVQAIRESLI